jgi:hypothetical protein
MAREVEFQQTLYLLGIHTTNQQVNGVGAAKSLI